MYILHLSDIHYRRELGRRKEADRGRADGEDKQHESGGRLAGPDGYQALLSAMQNPLVFLDDCLDRAARDWKTIDLVVIAGDLTEDGTAPVSYTHLDVYKRQPNALPCRTLSHSHKKQYNRLWVQSCKSGPV